MWEDLDKILSLTPVDLMGINHVGALDILPLDHWASLHPEIFHMKLKTDTVKMHGPKKTTPEVREWHPPTSYKGGTSSLFGVWVGLQLGYERIILGGCPMDATGHFFDRPGRTFEGSNQDYSIRHISTTWQMAAQEFNDRVRSVSGRTRQWLGEPDKAWLA